jgi:ankyrin repeat protein
MVMSNPRSRPSLYTQNPAIKIDLLKAEIIITEKSKELQKKGELFQNYVINTYIDEKKGVLTQTWWPTVVGKPSEFDQNPEPETETEKNRREKQEELIKKAQFDSADVIRAPPRGTTGIVHKKAKEKDEKKGEICVSGSAQKNFDNTMSFTGRSTYNYDVFTLNKEFEFLYFFSGQKNLEPTENWPFGVHMARSLSWDVLETWIAAQEKIQPELNEKKESNLKISRMAANVNSKSKCMPLMRSEIKEWQSLYNEDVSEDQRSQKFHSLWMHTIYIASGLKKSRKSLPSMPEEDILSETLKAAARYGISLNVDFIPDNIENTNGATALMQAAFAGKPLIVKKLIECGANIHAKDNQGKTVFDYAIQGNRENICQILIDKGFPIIEKKEEKDLTKEFYLFKQTRGKALPIHTAVHENKPAIVELLLENKSDPSAKNEKNWTPLHIAVARSNEKIIHILLKNNASLTAENAIGLTPVDIAIQHKNVPIFKLLLPKITQEHLEKISQNPDVSPQIRELIDNRMNVFKKRNS